MKDLIWIIPLFPLIGFVVNGLVGRRLGDRIVGLIGAGSVLASFIAALFTLVDLLELDPEARLFVQSLYQWLATGNLAIDIAFRIDALSITMVLVVTGVGFLIHVYSIGYMAGDRGFARYFAFLNLFTFAMLLLVMGDNFLLMFVGWEGVGLCSYLLIGFYYDQVFDKTTGMTCSQAGSKAFIVNRIGDFGFLLGMFLIFATFGTLDFGEVFSRAGEISTGVATAIALLLFLGATGKSAQLPLYVWLPDAMAGPTPVSALIHAATMVTAGVYMVARCSALFLQAPLALDVVAIVGVVTAAFAATMALTSPDIKKVLAYSTISQLGYMFLACGVGAFAAGIFHLVTHAFFKALLFLGAGSVMHALDGETQLAKMGDLKRHLPVTHATFLVGGLAISGVPLLSGFFSKDEILWQTFNGPRHPFVMYAVALVTAGLTAFYIFRMIYLTFYGTSRVDPLITNHVHESPSVMTLPLLILAVLAAIGGYIGVPHFNLIDKFLDPVFSHEATAGVQGAEDAGFALEMVLIVVSSGVALLGIYLAARIYLRRPHLADQLSERLKPVYSLLYNKYFVDEIYDTILVRPIHWLSQNFMWKFFDVKIIDGLVNFLPRLFATIASGLRRWQTGVIQSYAVSILIGLVMVLGYLLLR